MSPVLKWLKPGQTPNFLVVEWQKCKLATIYEILFRFWNVWGYSLIVSMPETEMSDIQINLVELHCPFFMQHCFPKRMVDDGKRGIS